MISSSQLESELIEFTTAVIVPCRAVVSLIESWRAIGNTGLSELSDSMKPITLQIQKLEQCLAPLRQTWHQQQLTMGPELQRLTAEHSDLLSRTLILLDEVAANFAEPRLAIRQQLDSTHRQAAMRRAYCS